MTTPQTLIVDKQGVAGLVRVAGQNREGFCR